MIDTVYVLNLLLLVQYIYKIRIKDVKKTLLKVHGIRSI